MKKLLVPFLLLAFALPLNAWVFLQDVTRTDGEVSPFLIQNIMQGKPVRMCLDFVQTSRDASGKVQKQYLGGVTRDMYYKQASWIITEALTAHINNARALIESTPRKAEFADVLGYLKKPQIVWINSPYNKNKQERTRTCDSYGYDNTYMDLRVMLEVNDELKSHLMGSRTAGTAGNAERHTIRAYFHPEYVDDNWMKEPMGPLEAAKYERIIFTPVITHELGHSLGLADQYPGGHSRSDIYTMAGLMELDSIKSLMNASRKLECDDAEGLINLVDFYSKDANSKRRTEGWGSICWTNLVYVESYPIKVKDNEFAAQLKYAAGGYIEAPAHIKRIKAEWNSGVNREAAAREKAAEEEAEKVAELKQKLDESPRCPICGKHTWDGDGHLFRMAAPRQKVTQGDKVVGYKPSQYGDCKVVVHQSCWNELKASKRPIPWKEWCSGSAKPVK